MLYFCMKFFQYNHYLGSTVDTDGLVLWHQGISSYFAHYTPIRFQLYRVNVNTGFPSNITILAFWWSKCTILLWNHIVVGSLLALSLVVFRLALDVEPGLLVAGTGFGWNEDGWPSAKCNITVSYNIFFCGQTSLYCEIIHKDLKSMAL